MSTPFSSSKKKENLKIKALVFDNNSRNDVNTHEIKEYDNYEKNAGIGAGSMTKRT